MRIPYDEEIFIGIDKNYKTLKKMLVGVNELPTQKMVKQLQFEVEEAEQQIRLY